MEGVVHAQTIAERVASAPVEDVPDVVFCSPFLRTARTGHVLALRLSETRERAVRLCVEEGLYEWLTPSLLVDPEGVRTLPRTVETLTRILDDDGATAVIDTTYASGNPLSTDADAADGSPRFPETEETLLRRCARTLSHLLDGTANADDSARNVAIVSHAPCDQAMAYALEGATVPDESSLEPWPLGGITMFSRTMLPAERDAPALQSEWKLEFYGDTSHMPGEYRPGIKKWSLPCLSKPRQQSSNGS